MGKIDKEITVEQLEHKSCNGCQMCGDLCPASAISFQNDELTGFWYPKVDMKKCINCGLCLQRCPQSFPLRRNVLEEPEVLATWTNDDDKRLLCTSGGMFYELAKYVINQGGAVVACAYTDDYRGAYHTTATTLDELFPLCGSKYLQSETSGIYKKTKELLETYPLVLFVGTPCQVAGLYSFFGKEYENLITADFICNSINSPKSQGKYIDYLEDEYQSKLIYARSKDKRYGWNSYGSSAKFENGEEYYSSRKEDVRVLAYHYGHLFVRESCLDCKYKVLPRNSDLTLGDFWGIEPDERNPKLELGTSVVMVNSIIGQEIIDKIKVDIGWYKKTLEDAIKGNPAILHNANALENRYKAFAALDNMRFDKVVQKYKQRTPLYKIVFCKIKKEIKEFLGVRK